MKIQLLTLLLITSTSCNKIRNNNIAESKRVNTISVKSESKKLISNDSLPNTRFGKSQIINTKFNPKLIFGVWTLSYEDPACDFRINEKSYTICDYDGNGERLYVISGDSIFLDNSFLIFKGKIVSVSKDSLLIHWQENEQPQRYLRWRD